jgi:glycosyltransferase involved in cell wall biosynthesis
VPRRRLWFVVESGTDVRLVDGLAERYDTTVLARRIDGGEAISRSPVSNAVVEIGPASRARFAAWAAGRIVRAVQMPAFVLAQGYGIGALMAQIACRKRIPSAMLVCSPIEAYYECRRTARDERKPFRRAELAAVRMVARLNARAGTRAVVLSEHLGDVMRGYGGRLAITVVPVYGVDVDAFHPTTRTPAEMRQLLGLPTNGSLVFFSSRIAPEKDVSTLLAAFGRLLSGGRDVWLLHRSGGYREFVAAAERAGVASRVIATDAVHPVRDLPASYLAADLCVQASRAEGLGFSVLEAFACGTPVVASAVGGLRETVTDGQTGWTCPPGDGEAMAKAIGEALDRPAEARRRAEAGRRLVLERYDRRRVFDRLDALIGAAVGSA